MRIILTLIILLWFCFPVYGQEKEMLNENKETLWLDIKSISFIKNNEYFNPIVEGYTLIGSFLRPVLIYAPSNNFDLSIGLHQQIYAGTSKSIRPHLLFSVNWKLSEKSILTLGALDGCDKHRMYDPHFNAERIYSDFDETGASFVTETPYFFSDTWINWENFIFKGDTVREIFTAGESFNYKMPIFNETIRLNLPLQAKFKHFGGQISNYSGHVLTFLNFSTGVGIDFNIANGNYGIPGVEYLHFIYRELTEKGDAITTHGSASWLRFHYHYKSLYFGSYLWFASNFFAPDGNQIYGCVSDYKENYLLSKRKIWTNSINFTFRPGGIFEFLLGFEGYYDFKLKRMDTAVAIHINFDRRIKLKSF
ncbi:MAG: hypothetical protein KBG40_06550 [Bacteroidales bacterium]|nr:hypothetical protein [Bacteroidales bacterium]